MYSGGETRVLSDLGTPVEDDLDIVTHNLDIVTYSEVSVDLDNEVHFEGSVYGDFVVVGHIVVFGDRHSVAGRQNDFCVEG